MDDKNFMVETDKKALEKCIDKIFNNFSNNS